MTPESPRSTLRRRDLLGTLGAGLLATSIAGCSAVKDHYEFDAFGTHLAADVRERYSYHLEAVRSKTVTRNRKVNDSTVEIEFTNYFTGYAGGDPVEAQRAGAGIGTTPSAPVLGTARNPLADKSVSEVVEPDTRDDLIEETKAEIPKSDRMEVGFAAFEDVDTADLLGEEAEFRPFFGMTTEGEGVALYLAKGTVEETIVFVSQVVARRPPGRRPPSDPEVGDYFDGGELDALREAFGDVMAGVEEEAPDRTPPG